MASEESPQLSIVTVVIFYVVMLALALGGAYLLDLDIWVWPSRPKSPIWRDALLGGGFGLVIVFLSDLLGRHAEWAASMNTAFREILGKRNWFEILLFAVCSGIAEEALFRGLLQQWLSGLFDGTAGLIFGWAITSLGFGLMHIGPDPKKFLPWTISAVVLGGCIGALYVFTGNLLAPIVAHFTINFFNFYLICSDG